MMKIMSGECDKCGEHAVECMCFTEEIQKAKLYYREVVRSITELEDRLDITISLPEYIRVDGIKFNKRSLHHFSESCDKENHQP